MIAKIGKIGIDVTSNETLDPLADSCRQCYLIFKQATGYASILARSSVPDSFPAALAANAIKIYDQP